VTWRRDGSCRMPLPNSSSASMSEPPTTAVAADATQIVVGFAAVAAISVDAAWIGQLCCGGPVRKKPASIYLGGGRRYADGFFFLVGLW
jgi:hypothetical protein